MKEYLLKPIMTRPTLDLTLPLDKPAVVRPVPPRQPLPRPVIDPTKPMLKLGLDTDLEFSMVVVQKDHASPQSPRKFTREQLVAYVSQQVAAGYQVFCVQESCGFGFTLHRELVAAGAQSFLITPVALNGKRKTDKVDAVPVRTTLRSVSSSVVRSRIDRPRKTMQSCNMFPPQGGVPRDF